MRFGAVVMACWFGLPCHGGQVFEMPTDTAAAAFVDSNIRATFYHELGHALIDVLQLPVLGREEDAADTLSSLLIDAIWDEDAATAIIYDTANAYLLFDAETNREDMSYADTHGLDLQRYYNLVCLFYGANPDVRDDIATELELPQDRAEGCAEEFDLAFASWGSLLEGLEPTKETKGLRLVRADPNDPVATILAEEITDLNKTYGLPTEITVAVAPCGEANAFYDPQDKSITICTEYAPDLARLWESGK